MQAPRFTLYDLRWCPYCMRVRRAANQLGIELNIIDVGRTPAARQRLIDTLGRATVPVLEIPTDDGAVLLPESADIIDHLHKVAAERAA